MAAGLPLLAEEHVIDTVKIDRGLLKGGREVFGPVSYTHLTLPTSDLV